jgi:hypothetical protein
LHDFNISFYINYHIDILLDFGTLCRTHDTLSSHLHGLIEQFSTRAGARGASLLISRYYFYRISPCFHLYTYGRLLIPQLISFLPLPHSTLVTICIFLRKVINLSLNIGPRLYPLMEALMYHPQISNQTNQLKVRTTFFFFFF